LKKSWNSPLSSLHLTSFWPQTNLIKFLKNKKNKYTNTRNYIIEKIHTLITMKENNWLSCIAIIVLNDLTRFEENSYCIARLFACELSLKIESINKMFNSST